jgi:phospholipase/carboxylesterase
MANDFPQLSLIHRVRPARQPTAVGPTPLLILFHGYGSNEDDLMGLSSYLDPRFNIVSARAPLALSIGGFAWFSLIWDEHGLFVRPDDILSAVEPAAQFVAEAIDAYSGAPERTLLFGFSQGATMGAAVLMHRPALIAGAALMSGFVPDAVVPPGVKLNSKRVLIAHGALDQVVPVSQGRAARDLFTALGAAVTYHEYPIAHQIDEAALEDVDHWLSEVLH